MECTSHESQCTLHEAERDIQLLAQSIAVLQAELRGGQEAMVLAREVMESKLASTASVLEARLVHLNALREEHSTKQLEWERKASTFFTKEGHEMYMKGVEADLRGLREWMAKAEGKASQGQVYWAFAVGVLGLFLAALGVAVQLLHFSR